MERKNFLASKRFWAGAIALITGISFVFTGEKTLIEQLPFIVTTALGLIQTIVALTSKDIVVAGRVDWKNRKVQ